MARKRRTGFGGILIILAGAWLIGELFVGGNNTSRTSTPDVAVESEPTPSVQEPEVAKQVERPAWVTGSRVAFRAGAGTNFPVIDRFENGREIIQIGPTGDWINVRDKLTLREGWIAARFLTDNKPQKRAPKVEKERPKDKPFVEPKPIPKLEISDAQIINIIIARSMDSYSGNCPCPFNRDRAGRQCGRRSAYSKPGGASPICYASDVTPAMISAFRGR